MSTSFASPTWTLGFAGSNFAAGSQYTIRALVTDKAGNTATTFDHVHLQPMRIRILRTPLAIPAAAAVAASVCWPPTHSTAGTACTGSS